jgi:hypothetical protein
MSNESDMYTKLGLNAERFAGYLYSGICFSVVMTLVLPTKVASFVDSIGGVLSLFSVVAIGFVIFIFYRYLIGEFIIFPLQHLIHHLFDKILGKSSEKTTSSIYFLKYLGVAKGIRRDAYTSIRDAFINDKIRARWDLIHGEIHALYITSIIFIGVSLFLNLNEVFITNWIWMFIGIVAIGAAFIADTHQHIVETRMIKALDRNGLINFLIQEGHLLIK